MTVTRVIRYRTRPERADENARLIEGVFDELAGSEVAGIRYTALRLEDGVTFVHVVALEDDHHNPLVSSPAFAAFQSGIDERVEEGPFPAVATVVGTYGGPVGG
jgi:hypothetical protein